LPFYGYHHITKQLNKDGVKINHKKVLSIMRSFGMLFKQRRRKVVTTTSSHENGYYPNSSLGYISPIEFEEILTKGIWGA